MPVSPVAITVDGFVTDPFVVNERGDVSRSDVIITALVDTSVIAMIAANIIVSTVVVMGDVTALMSLSAATMVANTTIGMSQYVTIIANNITALRLNDRMAALDLYAAAIVVSGAALNLMLLYANALMSLHVATGLSLMLRTALMGLSDAA